MIDDPIPADVRQLIVERIPTVTHLEAILLLRSDPQRDWTASPLAARLYIKPETCTRVLDELNRSGVVSKRRDGEPLYRYHPNSTELAGLLERLAETYRHHLIAVTAFIHSNAKSPMQQFADAFWFRKDN